MVHSRQVCIKAEPTVLEREIHRRVRRGCGLAPPGRSYASRSGYCRTLVPQFHGISCARLTPDGAATDLDHIIFIAALAFARGRSHPFSASCLPAAVRWVVAICCHSGFISNDDSFCRRGQLYLLLPERSAGMMASPPSKTFVVNMVARPITSPYGCGMPTRFRFGRHVSSVRPATRLAILPQPNRMQRT